MVAKIWNTRQNVFSFWTVFFPFTPLRAQKIKILKNWKRHMEILSFYTCIINDNHMIYCSWDMEHDRQNILSFWTVFCPFNNIKHKRFWKNEKSTRRYYHFTQIMIKFTQMYQKSWSYLHCFRGTMWTDVIFIFHFGLFFALLCPHP